MDEWIVAHEPKGDLYCGNYALVIVSNLSAININNINNINDQPKVATVMSTISLGCAALNETFSHL